MTPKRFLLFCLLALAPAFTVQLPGALAQREIMDGAGRKVLLPDQVDRLICSGPGCLRLITYFQAQDRVVGVDDIEGRKKKFDARPYALAWPGYADLPVFGGFRGQDDPEKILGLSPGPQVIFKTYAGTGHDPVALQAKTGIPVFTLEYGDLGPGRERFYHTLNLMGKVLGKEERAAELISFFNTQIQALAQRTSGIQEKKTCYVGGIAYKGPHGIRSTEPTYPPFEFIHAANVAALPTIGEKPPRHTTFSRETLLAADPDVIFLDLSTLQMGDDQGGLHQLRTDPVMQSLTAVKRGQVYGVLPYNWYTQNFGSILADAWYAGKVLYPERFQDISPKEKADEIYAFLLSARVFGEMNARFKNMAFAPVPLD